MTPRFVSTMQHTLVGAAAVAVLAMFAPPNGNTQGIKATATSVTPKGASDPLALQKQLQALERRVLELEKEAIETADDAAEADTAAAVVDQRLKDGEAAVKQLATRLASAEKKAGDDKAEPSKAGDKSDAADDDKPMTITAPFLVVDGDGKPLMRVGEDDGAFSRGVYVFNDQGASIAHMGARSDALGRIYASRPNTSPTAVLTAQPEGGALLLGNGTAFIVELNRQWLGFMTDNRTTLALFGTKGRTKGYLELNDGSGNKMVEAGMLNNNKGYVLASPYRATVDPHGDPSVLKGAGK